MEPFDHLLAHAQAAHAVELLLMAGDIPATRIGDRWVRLDHPRCTPADLQTCAQRLLTAAQLDELERSRELEFFYPSSDAPAATCNFHFQRGSLVLLARLSGHPLPHPDKVLRAGSSRA